MSNRPDDRTRGGGWIEPEPKPFEKLPLGKEADRGPVVGHEKFTNQYTGTLTCTLEAITPVHVGSGIYELVGDQPVRGLITSDGTVLIPGTSLKGAIRSIAEAISNSCVRVAGGRVKSNLSQPDLKPCNDVKKHNDKLCVACRIFGALGFQGRVSFTDAKLIVGGTETHQLLSPYPPRPTARLYKDERDRFNGRKFYIHGEPQAVERGEPYQVVKKGSQFDFAMTFESLMAEEFCLVLVAIGILDDVKIKVGGGKQAMLGTVEIWPERIALIKTNESFMDWDAASRIVDAEVTDFLFQEVGKANGLINEEYFDRLLAIWKYPSDRKAPTTLY